MLNLRTIRLLAAAISFVLIASACGGGSDGGETAGTDSPTTAAAAGGGADDSNGGADDSADGSELVTDEDAVAQSGGVLRVGVEGEPTSLNPSNSAFAPGAVIMGQAIFDTLTVWDTDRRWANNLTESWTPNDDFSVWEMKLRPGMTFTDGVPFNADAVVRSLQAQVDDPLVGLVFKPVFDPDVPFEKVDDLTVRINALGSNALIPAYFATQLGMIGSPAWFDARDADPSLDQRPIGAGPFMIEERVQDSVTRLVRNDNWWRTDQEIYLDAIEIYPNNQEGVRADQLLSGELEMNHASDADSILRFREEPTVNRIENDQGEQFFFIYNTGKAPFDDIRVRQAATHSFPEAQYEDLIRRGSSERADSLFAPGEPWYVPEITQITDQPELAGPLIEAYCADVPESCTDGKVDIEYQNNGPSLALDNIRSVMVSAWEPFFNITEQVVPQDNFILEVATGQFDVSTYRYHGNPDPEIEFAFLSCSTVGVISLNWSRYCDEDREALMTQQRVAVDEAERIAIWADIQQNIADAYQYLVVGHLNWTIAADESVMGICDLQTVDGDDMLCSLNGTWRFPQIWLAQ